MDDQVTSKREPLIVIALAAIAVLALWLSSCKPKESSPVVLEPVEFNTTLSPAAPVNSQKETKASISPVKSGALPGIVHAPKAANKPAAMMAENPTPAGTAITQPLAVARKASTGNAPKVDSVPAGILFDWNAMLADVKAQLAKAAAKLPKEPKPKEPPPGLLPKPKLDSYGEAYAKWDSEPYRPMLVLVCQEACGPCRQIEKRIPELREAGHFCHLDRDKDKATLARMGFSGACPQLIVYPAKGEQGKPYVGTDAIGEYMAEAKKEPWKPVEIRVNAIPAGFRYLGANVLSSQRNAILDEEAQQQASYQASVCQQGHQGWSQRYQRLVSRLGAASYQEICAESWPPRWQKDSSTEGLWRDAFNSWSKSPGHWNVASRVHQAFGSGMARSRNGVYFSTILAMN